MIRRGSLNPLRLVVWLLSVRTRKSSPPSPLSGNLYQLERLAEPASRKSRKRCKHPWTDFRMKFLSMAMVWLKLRLVVSGRCAIYQCQASKLWIEGDFDLCLSSMLFCGVKDRLWIESLWIHALWSRNLLKSRSHTFAEKASRVQTGWPMRAVRTSLIFSNFPVHLLNK